MRLRVEDLCVKKDGQFLIQDVSFNVPEGLIVALSGPSGAGKSTTLLRICGLLDSSFVSTGRVLFNGNDISALSPERLSILGVSIVLQGLALFPHRRVVDNVAYPLRRRGVASAEAHRLAVEKLAEFQMENFASRWPSTLSGGQQQRVALARAMVYNPTLLLLDEPFKGLEHELRDEFLALVRNLAHCGISIVLVTHERRELALAADVVVAMRRGRVEGIEHRANAANAPFALTSNMVTIPSQNGSSVRRVHPTQISVIVNGESVPGNAEVFSARVVEVRAISDDKCAVLVTYEGSGVQGWLEMRLDAGKSIMGNQPVLLAYQPKKLKGE